MFHEFLATPFTVALEIHSDWHVGSGLGRPGDVDRLLLRDGEGLPFVPAKTLTGIWRDAAERLAYALDGGKKNGAWSAWVTVLFGAQPRVSGKVFREGTRPAALSISPARFSKKFRDLLHARDPEGIHLHSALTFVKPGVAIDPATGTARQDFLRFEEMARGGASLFAPCRLALEDWTPGQKEAAAAFLLASAHLVERLGGKRRRGAGRCTLRIETNPSDRGSSKGGKEAEAHSEAEAQKQWEEVIAWLREHPTPPDPPSYSLRPEGEHAARGISRGKSGISGGGSPAMTWWSVPLRIILEKPLAIATRTIGNFSESLDFVPGTFLLSHFAKRLAKRGFDCRPYLLRGAFLVLPATIEIVGERGLPVPLVLARKKLGGAFDQEKTVVNRFREGANAIAEGEKMPQIKEFRGGYIAPPEEKRLPPFRTVPIIVSMHNAVADEIQRPADPSEYPGGALYSRAAIADVDPLTQAPLVLRSEVRVSDEVRTALQQALGAAWWKHLAGEARLGASRKDDYGAVRIETIAEPTPMAAEKTSGKEFVVWLLSDLLLRDEALRYTTLLEALQGELERALGVKLRLPQSASPSTLTDRLDIRRIESWQQRWGFPRPSLIAIRAGSCARFEVAQGTPDSKKLAEIEAMGLGERRAEGYGQIAFNPPILMEPISQWAPAPPLAEGEGIPEMPEGTGLPEQLTPEEEAYARRIEEACWREALQRAVLVATESGEKREEILGIAGNEPPMSQLMALRGVLQRITGGDCTPVRQWLDHLEKTPNRRDKWPQGARKKIRDLLEGQDAVWQLLEGHGAWSDPPSLVRTSEKMREVFRIEALQSLVDAAIRAHKRELEVG